MREHEWSSHLILNGYAVRLGVVSDVINKKIGCGNCHFVLHDDDNSYFHWKFEGERNEKLMTVREIRTDKDNTINWSSIELNSLRYLLPEAFINHSLPHRLQRLTYLTAERLGPREHYVLNDSQLTPVVGSRGEYAVSVLNSNRDLSVLEKLAIPGIPTTKERQVEARMATFVPGCELETKPVPYTNNVVLGMRTSRRTEFCSPTNVGFGLTQVLPIVVAALSAKENDLLLIEHPEVHLHPSGQAAMGEFLASVANAGVQVILETHSDHVLNGIRRAVKSGVLSNSHVALHFFRALRDDQCSEPQVESLMVNENGNIDNWPDGFFDQFDKDMNYFVDWG